MRKILASLLILLTLVSSLALSSAAVKPEPKTIVVPDDYHTIEAAISNAHSGDRIFVKQGTYNESQLTISKSVQISGENFSNTKLILNPSLVLGGYQLGGTGLIQLYYYNYSLVITADKVELSGFTISYQEQSLGPSPVPYEAQGGGSVVVNGNEANITGNDFTNTALFIHGSNSTIVSNTFRQLVDCYSSNNKLYHNNFVNGYFIEGVYDLGVYVETNSTNVWDDGYPSGGNYWGYLTTRNLNASMLDDSGISNKPYVIDSNNTDRYPLLEPFNSSFMINYLEEIAPPIISIMSPVNQTYNKSAVPLVLSVDKAINWASYSLDGQPNVTLTDNSALASGTVINETLTNLTSGNHNLTIYANSTFGTIGPSESISFTITKPETFPTTPVAVVALGVTAVVVIVGLVVYFKKYRR